MQPQNKERFESLRALAPVGAIQAWFDGDFGIGDEAAMVAAIRKDTRVALSDDRIAEIICDSIEAGYDARACLERLASTRVYDL